VAWTILVEDNFSRGLISSAKVRAETSLALGLTCSTIQDRLNINVPLLGPIKSFFSPKLNMSMVVALSLEWQSIKSEEGRYL
jgi:hypothetical protein